MAKPRIGIIIGSTRQGRFADKPAEWITAAARARGDLEVEVLDLRDYPLPFLGEPDSLPFVGPIEQASDWRKKLAGLDGFIVIAAEYNHGPTAVLKNALDSARAEWVRKPITYVGYGGVGGARAIEQLRMVAIEQQMAPTKSAVHILWPDYLAVAQGGSLADKEHLNQAATAMLDDLTWWTRALKAARSADVQTAKAA